MLRQRLALRLFRCGAWRPGDFDGCRPFICFELFQTQFELLDLMVQLLRFASELYAAQLRNKQLQMLDFGLVCRNSGLLRINHVLHTLELRVAFAQQGLQGLDVVWKGVRRSHADSLRVGADVYNAEVGGAVRVGWRQSMPSSSIDNWAGLRYTVPLAA